MTYQRKTVDVWEFWLYYEQGWECECIETSFKDMVENRKAYREAGFEPRIRRRRVRREKLAEHAPVRP